MMDLEYLDANPVSEPVDGVQWQWQWQWQWQYLFYHNIQIYTTDLQ